MRKLAVIAIVILCSVVLVSFRKTGMVAVAPASADTVQYPEESHFRNVQQLTFGGDNAEAYWSYDSKYLV